MAPLIKRSASSIGRLAVERLSYKAHLARQFTPFCIVCFGQYLANRP